MMTPKNEDALAFFKDNPDEKYWYYRDHRGVSKTLRVPNPTFYNRPDYQPDPWPTD